MADLKYDISVGVQNALAGLDAFIGKIQKANNEFENIGASIGKVTAGLSAALIGLAGSAAAFADEMSDVAAANETTIASVLGLSSALAGAGGKADSVGRMLQTLTNNVESANSGNLKMVGTFQKLGVSISDLGTLSQDELRNNVIKTLADMTDPIQRNALAMEVFGKAAVGVDWKALSADVDANTSKYKEYEGALKTAGGAFDSMAAAIKDIKIAAAVAFEPLFKYIEKMKIDIPTVTTVIKVMAVALAAAVSVSVLAGFAKLLAIMKDINVVVSKNKLITIIAAALAVSSAVGTWAGLLKETEDEQGKVNDKIDETNTKSGETKRTQEGLLDAIKKQKDSLSQVTENYSRQLQNIKDKLIYEQEALSLTEEQKKIKQEQNTIEQQAQQALSALKDKYNAMDADARKARASDYAKEQELIKQNADIAKKDVESRIEGIARLKNQFKEFQSFIKEVNDVNTKRFDLLSKEMVDNAGYKDKIELEQKLAALQKLRTTLTEGLVGLNDKEREAATEAITIATTHTAILKTGYDDVNKSIDLYIQSMVKAGIISQNVADAILASNKDLRDPIVKNAQEIGKVSIEIADRSRTFAAGWDKAFREYAENATNAATQARNIFAKMTQGMEDLIVNFAKTGKFEWKNFLNMMVEELLRSQIRQLMANLLSLGGNAGAGGGANWLSTLGGMLGFAKGGMVPTNQPVLVGERGPEIITGAGGRTVIPNDQIGGSPTYVTYNISAVDARSFKEMVAQDPSFIYAVSMQGAKGTPVRR